MIDLTNEQTVRLLKLQASLEAHLQPTIKSYGARKFLCEAILSTPSGKAHVTGTLSAPDTLELAAEAWATDEGVRLREVLSLHEASQASTADVEKEAMLAKLMQMKPVDTINEARRLGLTGL